MSRVASLHPAAKTAPSAWHLALFMGANMLAAIGGGRVLSAGTGITGLAMLGSGSILALLAGNALGLGLQLSVRRFPSSRALVWLSFVAVFSPLLLLAIIWLDAAPLAHARTDTVWTGGSNTLSPSTAWLFFFGLIVRCALWFAGRALRSDVAASLRPSWLAFTEAAYFLGFIIGLLIGPVSLAGSGSIVGALLLDAVLLSLVAGGDLFCHRSGNIALQAPLGQTPREDTTHIPPAFWRFTAAFCAATVACQVVVFHCADVLAQTRRSAFPAWSDLTIASFYLGIACSATWCAWARPTLEMGAHHRPQLVLWPATRAMHISLLLLVTLVSALTLVGLFGLMTLAETGAMQPAIRFPALAAVGIGAGVFETLVLGVLGRIRTGGSGAVALAFGVAATTAAVALFLMLLGGLRFPGWALTSVGGFALTMGLLWREQGRPAQVSQPTGH